MLWRISRLFQFAADRFIPDSFVFCVILTLIVFAGGAFVTDKGMLHLVNGWYDGLWGMISFAFQMAFMVVTCGAAAKAPAVERILTKVARIPKTPTAAMFILIMFGFVSSFINWAFCTILTPILAMQLSKNVKGLHFPMMIAAGYTTMILGQCWGPSSSVYALVATKGHFLEKSIGLLTQDVTVYNPVNTAMFFIVAIALFVVSIYTRPPQDELVMYIPEDEYVSPSSKTQEEALTPADHMNNSKILMLLIGIAGIIVIGDSFIKKGILASLNINFVIFIFLALNTFLYNTPKKFVDAFRDSMKSASEVMLQFPFYGGIMGIMTASGLANSISKWLATIGTADTIYSLSFLSAALLNIFIPSQGGQWIVQGPILTEAGKQLGANIPLIMNAFVHGDEVTNLIQPLYVIPALAIVGMKLKDVWGFMAFISMFWTGAAIIGFYILPKIFGM